MVGKLKVLLITLGLLGANAGVLIPTTVNFFSEWDKAQNSTTQIDEEPEVVAEALSVLAAPSKTVYGEGETFVSSGLQLMATVNGKKKKVTKGYTILNADRALTGADTFMTVSYGGQTVNIPITVVVINNILTIRKNGEFIVQAEDNGISTSLYNIADSNWAAGYNGSKFIEQWTNSRVSPSSGLSLANLGAGTRILFKFTLTEAANVQFYTSCAFSQGTLASSMLEFTIDDEPVEGADTNCQLKSIEGATDNGGVYWNWTNWYMGMKSLEAGTYTFRVTGTSRLPNVDSFKFVVTGMENGQLFTVNGNGTTRLEAEDPNIDRSTWTLRPDILEAGREPVENWSTPGATYLSQTSGQSVMGLQTGCKISIPFMMNGNAKMNFKVVMASSTTLNCYDAVKVTLDGFGCPGYSTTQTLGSAQNNQYFNWVGYDAGTTEISYGYHILVLEFTQLNINVDSFEFITTEYRAGPTVFDINGNGTTTFQAESARLPRGKWLIRDDFIAAGRIPVESWSITTSAQTDAIANGGGTSGQSTCGIRMGTSIDISFRLNGNARVQFSIICASYNATVASQTCNCKVDGQDTASPDTTLQLGKYGDGNNGEKFWNWKNFNAGYIDLTAGEHTLSIIINADFNIDSVKFVVTNYSA